MRCICSVFSFSQFYRHSFLFFIMKLAKVGSQNNFSLVAIEWIYIVVDHVLSKIADLNPADIISTVKSLNLLLSIVWDPYISPVFFVPIL